MPRKPTPTATPTQRRPVLTSGRACVVNHYLRAEYLDRLDALAGQLGGSRRDAIYHLLDADPRTRRQEIDR